jgi:hypothetical protein
MAPGGWLRVDGSGWMAPGGWRWFFAVALFPPALNLQYEVRLFVAALGCIQWVQYSMQRRGYFREPAILKITKNGNTKLNSNRYIIIYYDKVKGEKIIPDPQLALRKTRWRIRGDQSEELYDGDAPTRPTGANLREHGDTFFCQHSRLLHLSAAWSIYEMSEQ